MLDGVESILVVFSRSRVWSVFLLFTRSLSHEIISVAKRQIRNCLLAYLHAVGHELIRLVVCNVLPIPAGGALESDSRDQEKKL